MKKIIFALIVIYPFYSQALYKNYKEVAAHLGELNGKTQNIKTFVLGKSDAGIDILGVTIGSGSTQQLLVSTHHGNEYGSAEVAMAFIDDLAANPLPDTTIHIIPILNTTGFDKRVREERASGSSYDPNRDYPCPCGSDGPFNLKSTKALAEFIAQKNIITSATLHTSFPAVVYPWGFSTRDTSTAYDFLYKELGRDATRWSNYTVGNSAEVIYPADGTFEDYAFWKHGIWSLLFELGFSHTPTEEDVREMIKVNVPGLRTYFANAPKERATDHDFKGKCDSRLRVLDRRDE